MNSKVRTCYVCSEPLPTQFDRAEVRVTAYEGAETTNQSHSKTLFAAALCPTCAQNIAASLAEREQTMPDNQRSHLTRLLEEALEVCVLSGGGISRNTVVQMAREPWSVRSWTEAQKRRCVRQYESGITVQVLAKRYEAAERTVKRWIAKYRGE